MDSEQELNRKRAEWASINLIGVPMGCEPNFTQSLDACFKLLVPEYLRKYGEDATLELLTEWVQSLILVYTIDQAANILCKDLDKLIDSEKKDE